MNQGDFNTLVALAKDAAMIGDVPLINRFISQASTCIMSDTELRELKSESSFIYEREFKRYNYPNESWNVEDYLRDLDRFVNEFVMDEPLKRMLKVKLEMALASGEDFELLGNSFIVKDKSATPTPPSTTVVKSLPLPPGMQVFRDSFSLPRSLYVTKSVYTFSIREWINNLCSIMLEIRDHVASATSSQLLDIQDFELAKEWELEKFRDTSLVRSGVSPLSYSMTNPNVHRPIRENTVDKQVDKFIQDLHLRNFRRGLFEEKAVANKISMKLGRATGCTIYSRIKHGDWNLAATALCGVLGHGLLNNRFSIDFIKEFWHWGQYYPLAIEGQRFSSDLATKYNSCSRNGNPQYDFSILFLAAKARMIGNVPKEIQVTTRLPTKGMFASLQDIGCYATSKEEAFNIQSQWRKDNLYIFTYDLKNMDKAYTLNHNEFALSCYPDKKWHPWLWLENGVNTLTSSRKGLPELDILNTGHLIKASGENDTGYTNSNVNLRQYLGAVKAAYGYINRECPESILRTALSRVMVMGDDLICAVESKEIRASMEKYFKEYSNWKVIYSEIPVFLSIFFAKNATFNSVFRCLNNHFDGEHSKEHPLILTVSLGAHFRLLKQNPFFEVWRGVMDKFLSKYPLYCLCTTVEDCAHFVESDECKCLMIAYSRSGQKAADDMRDLLRGFVYNFTPSEHDQNKDFFIELLFALENNQPELELDMVRSYQYSKDLEQNIIKGMNHIFDNNFEQQRKVLSKSVLSMGLHKVNDKGKDLFRAINAVNPSHSKQNVQNYESLQLDFD